MTSREYVEARTVLLDALAGLGEHLDAVVLVGAQAVYLHAGEADLATAPTTTDADLALIPDRLAADPAVVDAMRAAGFAVGDQPGRWLGQGGVAVDLMTPERLCGPGGRRSARLPYPHDDKDTARRTDGLEAAALDHGLHAIRAFADDDGRSFEINVAGPAALVVSKVIKIEERLRDNKNRLKPKDGLDVLRLLRAVETTTLASSLAWLASQELSSDVAERAVSGLRTMAAHPADTIPTLAAEAERGFSDPDELKMSTVLLTADLLHEFDRVRSG